MGIPCSPPMPPGPGLPFPTQLGFPVLNQQTAQPIAPALPASALPRFISEFSLGNTRVLYWLATLARATYAGTSALFDRAARAVLPASYGTVFVANGGAGAPGYGIAKLPQGAIVVVSGTTQLGQWLDQVLSNGLAEWTNSPSGIVKAASMPSYLASANSILAALVPQVPNDDQILFVGHSMGGAVASLMHAWTSDASSPRAESRCVTFSSPKPGDARMVALMRTGGQVYQRLLGSGDFIPLLPPDIGLFNLAVPAPLQAVSQNWARYRVAGVPNYVGASGALVPGDEPFLPLLVAGAVVAAAAGNPLAPSAAHLMPAFAAGLAGGFDAGSASAYPNNWQNPTDLPVVNAELAAAGL